MARTFFKNPRWVAPLATVAGLASLGAAYGTRADERVWMPLFFLGFGLFLFITALESVTAYLQLGTDKLEYRENFKLQTLPKAEIERVTWEKGVGVAVQLRGGKWVILPTFFQNSQSITNSIRSWLKKP